MNLYWFNPENDLALAADAVSYTAPAYARKLHDAGAALPLWYGGDGDRVLCHGIDARWYERMARDFRLTTDVYDHNPAGIDTVVPWGWSLAARNSLIADGVPSALLPSAEALQQIRRLSHRRTALTIARLLHKALPGIRFVELPREVVSMAEVAALLSDGDGRYLKMPWSSSGRGVLDSRKVSNAFALRFAEDSIRRQGSVMIEPALNKTADFARLFRCEGGRCQELGTSVFLTDLNGAYSGNLLSSEPDRLEKLGRRYPVGNLLRVSGELRGIIEDMIAPYYNGVLGVDMLSCTDGSLHPVVEVNLRMTMGYVANRFAERFLAHGSWGMFTVKAGPAVDSVYEARDGRLVSGTLSLVPPNPHFNISVTAY